jgi:hypothetical protein
MGPAVWRKKKKYWGRSQTLEKAKSGTQTPTTSRIPEALGEAQSNCSGAYGTQHRTCRYHGSPGHIQ